MWFPGATAPEWLTGEYPGDRGFDPFGLARDPKDFAKYRDAEVLHGRWAMLGLVGCLMPEVLGNLGVAKLPAWYEVGGTVYGGSIDYLGNPEWIHAGNASVILLTTLLFMGPVEAASPRQAMRPVVGLWVLCLPMKGTESWNRWNPDFRLERLLCVVYFCSGFHIPLRPKSFSPASTLS